MLLLLLFNNIFFYDYFISQNELRIHQAIAEFEDHIESDDIEKNISRFLKETGAQINVYDLELKFIVNKKSDPNKEVLSKTYLRQLRDKAFIQKEGVFETIDDSGILEQELVYGKILKDQTFVVATRSLGLVGESVKMSNAFMLRAAIMIYFVGLVLIVFMSKFISRPITDITRIAKKMSKMDFNEALKVTSQDELGELSRIINELTEKLSQNIEALKSSNKQLEIELNKEKSMESMRRQFVSDVSHELKNPISVIMAYSSGLVQDIPETASDRLEYYQVIEEEAEIMNVLVKDLLDLSALESGIFTMTFEKVNVNEVVASILEKLSRLEKDKDLSVQCSIDEAVEIDSNPIRLNQLLSNLIGNAYKYSDHGGKISIEMFVLETSVQLIIANTGNIIPEESLNKIWDSFYQVDTVHEGNGLGLAIVKSLVELHGGNIRAYTAGQMTYFDLILPIMKIK